MKKHSIYFLILTLLTLIIIPSNVSAQDTNNIAFNETYINNLFLNSLISKDETGASIINTLLSIDSTNNIGNLNSTNSLGDISSLDVVNSKNSTSNANTSNIVLGTNASSATANTISTNNSSNSTNINNPNNTTNINNPNESKGTSDSQEPTIVVDPGHGGYDTGAIGPSGVREKDIALKVGLKLGALLKSQGYNVIFTRTSDNVPWPANVHLDLQTRVQIANNAHANYYISIHNNDSNLSYARGTETFFYTNSAKGKSFATSVQNALINSVHLQDRGVNPANFYVLKHTAAVSILAELAFISNPYEEKLLNSADYQDKFANALDLGIVNFIKNK